MPRRPTHYKKGTNRIGINLYNGDFAALDKLKRRVGAKHYKDAALIAIKFLNARKEAETVTTPDPTPTISFIQGAADHASSRGDEQLADVYGLLTALLRRAPNDWDGGYQRMESLRDALHSVLRQPEPTQTSLEVDPE